MPTTLTAGDRRTRVIRRDQDESGAEIWLLCEEVGAPSGLAIEPEDEPIYPMDGFAAETEEPPVLEVETSGAERPLAVRHIDVRQPRR